MLYYQGLAKYLAGDIDNAIVDLKRAVEVHWHPSVLVGLAYVLGQTHRDQPLLERLVRDLNDRATQAQASPYDFAELHAGLSDSGRAIDYLRRGMALQLPEMLGIGADPLFRGIKHLPEFQMLLVDLGLTHDAEAD